jgi:alpha-amylase/alpha-mannosidase (GH57 family)
MNRFICIHGHFYQPPRENPWIEAVEVEDGAYPYHDWNQRINDECYAANAVSRILDGRGRIVGVVNNYKKLSFNFGPTLLAWMEEKSPDTYRAILEADRESVSEFSGHGSALAQAYNHMILPLAGARDKRTQIIWGVRDFESRFGRLPEGMWLPETAVDLESLELLREQGISFTVLAPHQAARVRRSGDREWRDLGGAGIDPAMPYQINLPSGGKMALFFYDGPIAQGVAFEGLLDRGENLADRLAGAFPPEDDRPRLVHIATDGETYGHHHKFGNMALTYAIHHIESNQLARFTNYGEHLERFPPTHEVEINENTSWSCVHGIERWRSDCGCSTGGGQGWNQAWRGPLREALDRLRDSVFNKLDGGGGDLFKDPWAARDDYIGLILDRSRKNVDGFLEKHAARGLSDQERIAALKLMEIGRHSMLMYTSCGWFFNDISGIETIQILRYAGRAIQLSREVFSEDPETPFLEMLEKAESNDPAFGDGRNIYEKHVRPAMVNLPDVAAHYAVSSVFEEYPEDAGVYCYRVECDDYRRIEAGRANLVVGRARISSTITEASARLGFGVLHMGDHNLNAGVRAFGGDREYRQMKEEVTASFDRADLPEVIRLLDKHFGQAAYNLKSLFRDQQREILKLLLDTAFKDGEAAQRQFFEYHAPLMRFLVDLGVPLPREFENAAEFIVSRDLWRSFEDDFDPRRVAALMDEAETLGLTLDFTGLGYSLQKSMERKAAELMEDPEDVAMLEDLSAMVDLALSSRFESNLWDMQNIFWNMMQAVYPGYKEKADRGDEGAKHCMELFEELGQKLSVRVG